MLSLCKPCMDIHIVEILLFSFPLICGRHQKMSQSKTPILWLLQSFLALFHNILWGLGGIIELQMYHLGFDTLSSLTLWILATCSGLYIGVRATLNYTGIFGIKLEIILVKENASNRFSSEVYDPLATVSWLGLEYHIYISSYWTRFESSDTLVGHPHHQNTIIVSLGVSCHLYLKLLLRDNTQKFVISQGLICSLVWWCWTYASQHHSWISILGFCTNFSSMCNNT